MAQRDEMTFTRLAHRIDRLTQSLSHVFARLEPSEERRLGEKMDESPGGRNALLQNDRLLRELDAEENSDEHGKKGMYLGYEPRNENAAAFYARIGFKPIEGVPYCVGLNFDGWPYA